jgi:hypothetical protein
MSQKKTGWVGFDMIQNEQPEAFAATLTQLDLPGGLDYYVCEDGVILGRDPRFEGYDVAWTRTRTGEWAWCFEEIGWRVDPGGVEALEPLTIIDRFAKAGEPPYNIRVQFSEKEARQLSGVLSNDAEHLRRMVRENTVGRPDSVNRALLGMAEMYENLCYKIDVQLREPRHRRIPRSEQQIPDLE